MPICKTCKKDKKRSNFHNAKIMNCGHCLHCISCVEISRKKKYRSKKGFIGKIYHAQKRNSTDRGHEAPTYTQEELYEWMMSQELFHVLFDNWIRLDYQSIYAPSVDRKDDYIGYTMSNIQIMTWGENRAKGQTDRRTGKNTKISKAVIQLTKSGEFVAEYISATEAEKQTSIDNGDISRVCYGKRKSAGGYTWKFTKRKEA